MEARAQETIREQIGRLQGMLAHNATVKTETEYLIARLEAQLRKSRAATTRTRTWSSLRKDKEQYIEELRSVISHRHLCDSQWQRTVSLRRTFDDQTEWTFNVEVFSVKHPNAKTAYAWTTLDGNLTAVLGIPPVIDPQSAVSLASPQE